MSNSLKTRLLVGLLLVTAGFVQAATLTWTGIQSDSWFNAAKWSPAQVPTSADTVVITDKNINIPNTASFAILNINGTSTVNGTNTITGTLNLNGGTVSLGGFVLAGGAIFNWAGGNIQYTALTVQSGAQVNLSGSSDKQFRYGSLTNDGTITVTGTGNLDFYTSTFENEATGTFDLQNNQTISYGTVNNAGLFRKSVGTGTTSAGCTLNNTGTVSALTGTLGFSGGGVLGGTYNASSGAIIDFTGGAYSHLPGVTVGGTGVVRITGGTLNLDAVITNLQLLGGTLRLKPAFQGGNITSLTLNGSMLEATNTITGTLTVNGGGVNMSRLTVANGAFVVWTGGNIQYTALTAASGGTINISGSPDKLFRYGFLTNNGTINVAGTGNLDYFNSSVENQSGGTFDLQNNQTISYGTFNNGGTFRKSVATGTSTVGSSFSNLGNGTVNALTGTLNFSGGGVLGGNYITTTGTVIGLTGGVYTHLAVVTATGAGNFRFTGGTLNLDALIANLQLLGGTLRLTPAFQGGNITSLTIDGSTLEATNTVTGTLTLNSGGINQSKLYVAAGATLVQTGGNIQYTALTVSNAAAMNISGAADKLFRYGFLTNAGTITIVGTGNLDYYLSTVENQAGGLFDLQNNQTISYGTINNAGTFRKSVGTGTTTVGSSFNNSGTVSVLTGTLAFSGVGALSGTFTTVAGSVVDFTGGTFTHLPGLTLSGGGIFRITGGTFILDSVIPGLQLLGGTLHLTPTFQGGVITNLTINGSTLEATNTVTGTLTLLSGGVNQSKLVIASGATLNWSGGGFQYTALTISALGAVNISGAPDKLFRYGFLTNIGAITVTGTGNLDYYLSTIENQAGGLFDLQNDQTISYGNINNGGLFRKSVGTGTTTVGSVVNNSGTVSALTGTFAFSGGGVLAGTFTTTATSIISLTGGTYTHVPSLVLSGAGVFKITGGTLILDSVIPNLQLLGGTLKLTPIFQGGNITNLTVSGSTLAATNTVTGTLTLTSGGIDASKLVIANGAIFNWGGGSIQYTALTVFPTGAINISGSPDKLFRYGFLTNTGTITVIGTGNLDYYLSTVENQATGVFDFQNNQTVSYGTINNIGLFRKTVGTGTTTVGSLFNNNGTVSALSGTFAFGGGGVLGGTFTTVAGTTISFSGGTFTHIPGLLLSGAGVFQTTGGTLILDAVIPNLQLAGGNLRLNPGFQSGTITNLTINGSLLATTNTVTGTLTMNSGGFDSTKLIVLNGAILNWGGGNIQYTALTVMSGGAVNLSGAPDKLFRYGFLTNNGVITVAGTGNLDYYLSAVENQANGIIDLQNSQALNYGTINNAGLFRKSAGASTTTFSTPLVNTGTVEVRTGIIYFTASPQTSGTLLLNGGSFTFNQAFTLTNGVLRGNGGITGTITNASQVNPDGIITITGNFVQTAAGSLRFDIGGLVAGTQYDRLAVTGKITLDGVANLYLANGFFPVAGDTFQVLSFGSKSNLFSAMNGRNLGGGIFLNPVYTATSMSLLTSDLNGLLFVVSNGGSGIQLRLSGGGDTYVVEACTHLKNPDWTPVSTNTLPGGAVELTDPTSVNFPTRFYRARYVAAP